VLTNGASKWPLTSIQCQGSESMDLLLYSPHIFRDVTFTFFAYDRVCIRIESIALLFTCSNKINSVQHLHLLRLHIYFKQNLVWRKYMQCKFISLLNIVFSLYLLNWTKICYFILNYYNVARPQTETSYIHLWNIPAAYAQKRFNLLWYIQDSNAPSLTN
jgi:hypothetical protein